MAEAEEFNRIHALLKFDRDDLIRWVGEYFNTDDSYAHWLGRCKSAYGVGTMTVDDFTPFDDSTSVDFADFLLAKLRETD